jgi:acyl-CoA synthetase (AMP-forming)/AMP-acid ligase II
MSMIGTVGPPVPNIDVRLESVPEMDYNAFASRARGEICIRGETLFSGYYKRDDLTKEVLADGWFHTGEYCSLSILFTLFLSCGVCKILSLVDLIDMWASTQEFSPLISFASEIG